jgi:TPR repeat protein
MDETASIEAILERAKAGDAEAQNDLGRHFAQSGSRAEAEQWFRRAAEQGLAKAKHNLGVLYWQDQEGSQEAIDWFHAAARDGWLPSFHVLGVMLEEQGDREAAKQCYLTAAQRGHADSQNELSRLHFKPDTEEDNAISRRWAEAAAQQGHVEAMMRLGLIHNEGRATPRDPERAAAYMLQAANLGHDMAQFLLGVLYHTGAGVPPDSVEAAHWVLRSAEQGNEMAADYLQARAGLADLPKHEIAEAHQRARQPLPWTKPTAT